VHSSGSHILSLQVADFSVAVVTALAPALRGRPVAVVSSTRSMGRVLCLSPEARAAGLVEGLAFPAAKRLCRDASFLPPDAERERRAEASLLTVASRFSPCLQRYGPGRLFLDVRGTGRLLGHPLDAAGRLRRELSDDFRLSGAVGLSPRRPLSHLAGRAVRPAGIMELLDGREDDFLALVPPDWVAGVGPKTMELLRALNITRLATLRQFTPEELVEAFGTPGRHLAEAVLPTDCDDRIPPVPDPLSLLPLADGDAVEMVAPLREESVDDGPIRAALLHAVAGCGQKLREKGVEARALRVAVTYADGRTGSSGIPLVPPASRDSLLLAAASTALDRARSRRVRLCSLSLRCTGLLPALAVQGGLFSGRGSDTGEAERKRLTALDAIRRRFGGDALITATELAVS
jgi:DNA polymerase-4